MAVDLEGNPLAEVKFDSLDKIFSADPRTLSEEELTQVLIPRLVAERKKWEEDQAAGKPTRSMKSLDAPAKEAKVPKAKKAPAAKVAIDASALANIFATLNAANNSG